MRNPLRCFDALYHYLETVQLLLGQAPSKKYNLEDGWILEEKE